MLWTCLCVILPSLFSVVKILCRHYLELMTLKSEQMLALSVDTVIAETKYENLENSEVHTKIQKLQSGANMVGPVSSVIRNQLSGILKNGIFLLACFPLIWALIATDDESFSPVFLETIPEGMVFVSTHTLLFFLFLFLLILFAVRLRIVFRQKETELTGKFVPVEREYQYYVKLRADYENGADIRLNGLRKMLQARMKTYNCSERKMHFAIGRQNALADGSLSVLLYVENIAVIFFIICKILYGTVSIGGFYLYANAFVQAISYLTEIMRQAGELKVAMSYYDAYPALWELNRKSVLQQSFSTAAGDCEEDSGEKLSYDIVFRNVSFRYPGSSQWILKNLNLTIRKGEHIAIVGRNGAGKSTLIKLLTGLYSLETGQIFIHGKEIRKWEESELYSLFGVVYQDYRLLAASVEENITAGAENVDRERVRNVMSSVGLWDMVGEEGLRHSVSRYLSEKGILFSGGEEQKLAIARALYKNAPIVVMDEPAAALDPIAEQEINALLNRLSETHTALVISHRLSTCMACDRILVLDDGRIVEDGTQQELIKQGGIYAKMWETQARHYK